MAIAQLGYIGIGTSDLKAWEQFATGVLGMAVSERGADGTLYLRMDEYHHRIIVHPGGPDDLLYAGWETPNVQTLGEVRGRLKAAGVEVREVSKDEKEQRKVCDLIRVADPSGTALELFYGPMIGAAPFYPMRPISGFKAGSLGLGHIVLVAKELDRTVEFYRDVLGFQISDYVHANRPGLGPMTLVFFHCNPRHHSLALIGAALGPKKISHFMIELNSLDDVGTTYDLCRAKEVPIVMALGRHSNDHMVSFYMQNPSGFNVEYGWNGRLVDDATWVVQQHTSGSTWGHTRMTAR